MTNVIALTDNTLLNELERKLNTVAEQVNELTKATETAKMDALAAEVVFNNAEKGQKTTLKTEWANKKVALKLAQDQLRATEAQRDQLQKDILAYKGQHNYAVGQATSQTTAKKVFDDHNIHYVIFDQQWWSVDPAGDRMSVKINSSDSAVIKDLIYNDSNWEINNEQELKRLAKSMNRMYKHIVRDFNPATRPGIYNQMTDIRQQWLKPIPGVMPHEAFRLLTLSIAGGNEEYADQLERFVAYRYCHPEDVMIPNIDSCATGGTGRDTYFNILSTIFTNECCGSAGEETFKGTHNGDLFGKMIIKVDEKNSNLVPIDKIKELTGGTRYRHRQMNKDARDAVRLFNFIFFRNGYTTTAKLSGTGSSGEDRRFEPIIARVNLPRYVALHFGLIDDINTVLTTEQTRAMQVIIKDWQRDYYKNETRIAEWLGHIITKHDAEQMTELLPIHGIYYQEMLERQRRGLDGFMPKLFALMNTTTVISVKDVHRLYEAAESVKINKDGFKNQLLYWLNSKAGWDSEVVIGPVYPYETAHATDRRRITYIQNRLSVPAKHVFDLAEFIDSDAVDDRGTTVGMKINSFSIRDELR